MIINRENYQVWVTDYYDGRLDDFQVEVLKDFMSENPDLMAEFEDYPEFFLKAEETEGFDINSLLKSPDQLTNEQVEHYSIALLENDLNEKQKKEISELQKTDPRFRENISFYKKIKLIPVEQEYPFKSDLKRIPARRRTIRYIINSLSVAASIAIIVSLFIVFGNHQDDYTSSRVIASGQSHTEELIVAGEAEQAVDLSEGIPAYIVARQDVNVTEPLAGSELVMPDPIALPGKEMIKIPPLAAKADIRIDRIPQHYLLAETNTYAIPPVLEDSINTRLSVREFLAFQFRKEILDDEDPDIENLKAWEIADAGIKGFNKILGWNMQLETEENRDGKLQNISFTSELIKFDHKSKKNSTGL